MIIMHLRGVVILQGRGVWPHPHANTHEKAREMCGLRCSHQIRGAGVMIGQLVSVPCCLMLSATHLCACVSLA